MAGEGVWLGVRCYTAYLPPAEASKSLRYAVLALEAGRGEGHPRQSAGAGAEVTSPEMACTPPQEEKLLVSDFPLDSGHWDSESRSTSSNEANFGGSLENNVRFFLFKKEDVSPPQLKQMLGKVRSCFQICPRSINGESCNCHRAHLLKKKAWRLELSSFEYQKFYVSHNNGVRCIEVEQIRPTAGFFFACGLLHENIVDAVQPIVCRYNDRCRYGSMCLFIHADIGSGERKSMRASMDLKTQLIAHSDTNMFLNILEELELRTVGDVQQLSDNAFDAIVSRSDPRWLVQWLNIATLRDIQPKATLESVLSTFHDIIIPLSLPPTLSTVASLVQLSSREFYSLPLPLKLQAACEKIRSRFEPDRNYKIIDLKKEIEGSFFLLITNIITSFRYNNTHDSWRKKNPLRPVVTSLITYVDSIGCNCRANTNDQLLPLSIRNSGRRSSQEKYPEHSWCRCTRSYVIALNYELSTPSGSRCSEQNALGKLASTGLPTSVVREVFVHGENKGSQKDPNPLFPCGVCENMLRKVTYDVYDAHGGDVMLYMFDSTLNPKKIVYLPISEISYRGGSGFKKFVSDLREE